MNKAESAKRAALAVNPTALVEAFPYHLDAENATRLFPQYDIIVDATDNAQTRYLISDASVRFGRKPLVSGSALRWEGQLCVYNWKDGPCYRCLFPVPPIDAQSGACELQGVIGPAPGVIGVLQALEVIKIASGLHDKVLSSRMIVFDGLDSETPWRSFRLRPRSPTCSECNVDVNVSSPLKDAAYASFCPAASYPNVPAERNLTVASFLERFAGVVFREEGTAFGLSSAFVIDVRPAAHFALSHLPGTINWPIDNLLYRAKLTYEMNGRGSEQLPSSGNPDEVKNGSELLASILEISINTYLRSSQDIENKPVSVAFVCRRGNDSSIATEHIHRTLTNVGGKSNSPLPEFRVYNLQGGLLALKNSFFRTMPLA
eukprot:GHVT01047382.1.p1 GENE.GHVT01047382.1~~GHVT01047382.1.p1  ORF type:complete len:374 (+),score=11.97 GHVT01047382.1:206-1327(+)